MYQYGVVRRNPGGKKWEFMWARGTQRFRDFFTAMDTVGKLGWKAIAAGDFGGSPSPEVLLKFTARRQGTTLDPTGVKAMKGGDGPFPRPPKDKDGPFPKSKKPRPRRK